MERIHKSIKWMMAVTLIGHVFCCVLPGFVALLSILTGMGMLSTVLPFFDNMHHLVHGYEISIMIFSGIMLFFGWSLQIYSNKIDCHSTGCHHEPCGSKKKRSSKILIASSLLFMANLIIVLFVSH